MRKYRGYFIYNRWFIPDKKMYMKPRTFKSNMISNMNMSNY